MYPSNPERIWPLTRSLPAANVITANGMRLSLCDNLALLGLMGHGGLAEYCKVPISMCIELPRSLSLEYAASG